MKTTLLLFLISLSANASAGILKSLPKCSPDLKQSGDVSLYWQRAQDKKLPDVAEDLCEIAIKDIHPTQFAVGMYSAKLKAKDLKDKSGNDLDKYLAVNPEPIVIGPKGEFYIIDHHHLAVALDSINKDSTYGIILENWYGSDETKFWNYMKEKKWVYLVDQNGNKKTISDLLKVASVKDLKDDPNRSLAGETRCSTAAKCKDGQWLKEPVPFIEFLWAEHFRKTPSVVEALKKYGDDKFGKVIDAATEEVKRLGGKLPDNEKKFIQ